MNPGSACGIQHLVKQSAINHQSAVSFDPEAPDRDHPEPVRID
jgi:hypothetical protein